MAGWTTPYWKTGIVISSSWSDQGGSMDSWDTPLGTPPFSQSVVGLFRGRVWIAETPPIGNPRLFSVVGHVVRGGVWIAGTHPTGNSPLLSIVCLMRAGV